MTPDSDIGSVCDGRERDSLLAPALSGSITGIGTSQGAAPPHSDEFHQTRRLSCLMKGLARQDVMAARGGQS